MRTVFWIGDGCCVTGFARVAHSVIGRLLERDWRCSQLAVNYRGDPHPFPYPIYPARLGGQVKHDVWGFERIKDLMAEVQPDIVIINADPWNVCEYLDRLKDYDCPIVAYMPVDAPNIKQEYGEKLKALDVIISYTEFGANEFKRAGYDGPVKVIPHGFSANNFFPVNK